MRRIIFAALSVALIATPAMAGKPSTGGKTTSPTTIGNDISYPQCDRTLPTDQAFGIVGVNGGKASNFNLCFATQLEWAKGSNGSTSQPKFSVYLNTGNPGDVQVTNPELVSYWPTSGVNRYGTCEGSNSPACAYEYGKYMAKQDVAHVKTIDSTSTFKYWLDVETSNSWSSNLEANRADLEGMVDYLESQSLSVGVYSTAYQWNYIMGSVSASSPLAAMDEWRAGARNLAGAKSNCKLAPFTPNGKVVLTQYVSSGLDYNYSCVN